MKSELLIRFTDPSNSFTCGVEFGRLLQKMEQGEPVVGNSGFPVHAENWQVLVNACQAYGYRHKFSHCPIDGWMYFTATHNIVVNKTAPAGSRHLIE